MEFYKGGTSGISALPFAVKQPDPAEHIFESGLNYVNINFSFYMGPGSASQRKVTILH